MLTLLLHAEVTPQGILVSAADGSQRRNNNNRKYSRCFYKEPNQADPWWAALVKSKLSGPIGDRDVAVL